MAEPTLEELSARRLEAMTEDTPLWVIVSLDIEGFKYGRLVEAEVDHITVQLVDDHKVLRTVSQSHIVAAAESEEVCKANFYAAQRLEKHLRPMWQAAIEHEMRTKQIMLDAVYAAARGFK